MEIGRKVYTFSTYLNQFLKQSFVIIIYRYVLLVMNFWMVFVRTLTSAKPKYAAGMVIVKIWLVAIVVLAMLDFK